MRAHRHRRGETIATIAARIGTDKGTLSRWERGLAEPSGEKLALVADALSVPVAAIWGKAMGRANR